MASREIVWQVPEDLYRELVEAQEKLNYPSLSDLISQAVQRRLAEIQRETWEQEFRDLQRQVRSSGGLGLGQTKEEVIARLRQIRQQVFEEDYARLY
ncbi:MAG: hypothetical protein HY782_00180 [Chloroflexi bacterium]|nr:hypothetical protein [Chloroflexota bacterium]